ncbi:MAG: hypothetical protein CR995_00100 [Clostridiales bacterium]|nr:MAG: hypothetical protein CR995_00100 [Clostridiales bacterium]
MFYWQIMNNKQNKLTIFDKPYSEQLAWYYLQFADAVGLRLAAVEQTLADMLNERYARLTVNRAPDRATDCQYDVVLDGSYIIKKPLNLTELITVNKQVDTAYLYRYKKSVVAVLLPTALRTKLQTIDGRLNDYSLTFDDLLQLLTAEKVPLTMQKLKKSHVLSIDDSATAMRFMAWLNALKLRQLASAGVMIWDAKSTWIEPTVKVGRGSQIYPGCLLRGDTIIGEQCTIGPAARISDSRLGRAVSVVDSTVISSSIDDQTKVGPYAYLRPNSDIGKDVKIGDFVEVKNARIDDGSKVSHLSYIGDGFVGKNVNIGCGTVFVNYDGVNKHKTVVEDNCFIGCNANLVSPVTVQSGAYVAAGSTITDIVPAGSLAIARSHQVVKPDWAKNWTQKHKK